MISTFLQLTYALTANISTSLSTRDNVKMPQTSQFFITFLLHHDTLTATG